MDNTLGTIHTFNQTLHDSHTSHYEGGMQQCHKVDNYNRALRLAREPYAWDQGNGHISPVEASKASIWHDGQYYWDF